MSSVERESAGSAPEDEKRNEPSIFISQAKLVGEPRDLNGIIEVDLTILGSRPRAVGKTVRVSPDQYEIIRQNKGHISPENELMFIKDEFGLITPEAKLLIDKQIQRNGENKHPAE